MNYLFAELTQDSSNAATEMNMWCDNLRNNLLCAAKDQQLNDFLVSLAPSVSMKYVRILLLQTFKKIFEKVINYLYNFTECGRRCAKHTRTN